MANKTKKKIDQSEESSSFSGSLKKIISVGTAAGISKDLIQSAVSQVNKTKDEVSALVVNEVVSMINKIDFVKEFSKFAEEHKFKVTAEIEIVKKSKK